MPKASPRMGSMSGAISMAPIMTAALFDNNPKVAMMAGADYQHLVVPTRIRLFHQVLPAAGPAPGALPADHWQNTYDGTA